MSRSINLHHLDHQQHHRRSSSSSTSHLYDPQILVPFDYNLIYYFNFIPDQPTTYNNNNYTEPTDPNTKHTRKPTETRLRLCLRLRLPLLLLLPLRLRLWDAYYRVRTRLRRHRLPAQRGVRHHQRLVQLQPARRQGLRQLSDLQAQERLQQQPGESLLVVG